MVELKRILFVDDEQNMRDLVDMVLTTLGGYKVLTLSSGAEAVEAAPSFKPDLLLLDLAMPAMDGKETLEALRAGAVGADVPAVFLTAFADKMAVDELLAIGAIDVIEKPFQPMALCDRIAAIWQRAVEDRAP